jgi:hypothetical protein
LSGFIPNRSVFTDHTSQLSLIPSSVAGNASIVLVEIGLVSWTDAGKGFGINNESGGTFVALSAGFVPEIWRNARHACSVRTVVRLISGADTDSSRRIPKSTVFAD